MGRGRRGLRPNAADNNHGRAVAPAWARPGQRSGGEERRLNKRDARVVDEGESAVACCGGACREMKVGE